MDKIKVLLVEDELTLSMIIKETLEEKGEFVIFTAGNGDIGLQKYHNLHPDVIVADVMMPVMDGFEMIRQIRETNPNIPVLFLTARSTVEDVVEGFTIGGNDYLKKPFGMNELIIRIKALMNRAYQKTQHATSKHFKIGSYTFDSVSQSLFFAGEKAILSHRESELLKRLCDNKNQILHTKNILLDLWGDDDYFTTRSLHVFITKLRQKLAKDPNVCIMNVRGIGYKLIVENN
nr:response regulator transcription factor [uncultured Draconibacterium sp.]